jgi:glycosyltransferase involved in cell wall biosynthesis
MKYRLIVLGPVPPPYHGVTVSTALVLANPVLGDRFAVAHVDTSDRRSLDTIARWDFQNIRLGLLSLVHLARRLRGAPGVVYLPLSASLPGFLRDTLYIHAGVSRGWKVAVHVRGSEHRELYDRQPRLLRSWMRASLRRCSSVAVMGERLRWLFEGLVLPERIAVVGNGTPRIELGATRRDSETGLFLSNLRRRKGVVEALETALIVVRERPSARFVFVGDSIDARLDDELHSRAREAGGRIEFRPVVSGEAKRELLASVGYLLFPPTESEGHPRVVLEAMAAGLPVISTDRGAIADTVSDGVTGFVLPEADPSELASRVLRLLGEPGLQGQMAHASIERYHAHFTQEIADRRIAEWLEGLLHPPRDDAERDRNHRR